MPLGPSISLRTHSPEDGIGVIDTRLAGFVLQATNRFLGDIRTIKDVLPVLSVGFDLKGNSVSGVIAFGDGSLTASVEGVLHPTGDSVLEFAKLMRTSAREALEQEYRTTHLREQRLKSALEKFGHA